VSYAESAYVRLSKELDHELRFRVPLVIYKTHGEFEGRTSRSRTFPEPVGAFAEPVQNRHGPPDRPAADKLYALITHELTHIFQYSMFFEGYLGRALRARIPTGSSRGWPATSRRTRRRSTAWSSATRSSTTSSADPVPRLSLLLNYRYGHAVFDFIEQEYGKDGVRNFIYEYSKVLLTGNIEKAVSGGVRHGHRCLQPQLQPLPEAQVFPRPSREEEPGRLRQGDRDPRAGRLHLLTDALPSGELIAALASPKQELDLVVLSAEDGKTVKNLTKGWTNKYRYLVTEAFSGRRDLSWSPTSDQLAVFVRKENKRELALYDAIKGHLQN
jgi:hypothetical protein